MRARKPYFAGSIPTAPLYWFLSQSLRYIGAGVWSYVSGFLAELHSSIWRLWPCILAILQDKITSLIGDLLHRFFLKKCSYLVAARTHRKEQCQWADSMTRKGLPQAAWRGQWAKSSATGTRALVARVRAEYPDQLDYSGWWQWYPAS